MELRIYLKLERIFEKSYRNRSLPRKQGHNDKLCYIIHLIFKKYKNREELFI